jgi:hypothetical protein
VSTLQPLTPPIAVSLTDDPEPIILEAREAGRSPDGLRAVLIARNGHLAHSAVVPLPDTAARSAFAVRAGVTDGITSRRDAGIALLTLGSQFGVAEAWQAEDQRDDSEHADEAGEQEQAVLRPEQPGIDQLLDLIAKARFAREGNQGAEPTGRSSNDNGDHWLPHAWSASRVTDPPRPYSDGAAVRQENYCGEGSVFSLP